jgi:CRP-like cAMP-binding protein
MLDEDLIRNDLLTRFPRDVLDRVRPELRKVKLVAGQVLYEPGEEVHSVYFPERGLISILTANIENTSRGRDGCIGFIEACGSGVMVSRAVVQIGGEAWRLPGGMFRAIHEESAEVRQLVQRRIEFWLAETRQEIACQALHQAPARLARLLLECAHHTGGRELALTHEFMAEMIGVGRPTITQAASELKRLGLIRYTRGTVHLVDSAGLQHSACDCFRDVRRLRERLLGPPVEPRPFRAEAVAVA